MITTVIVVVPTVVGVTVKLIVAVPAVYDETVAATLPTVTVMLEAAKLAVLGPANTKVHVPLVIDVFSTDVPTATEVGRVYNDTVVVAGAPRNGPTTPEGDVTRI